MERKKYLAQQSLKYTSSHRSMMFHMSYELAFGVDTKFFNNLKDEFVYYDQLQVTKMVRGRIKYEIEEHVS